MSFGVTHIQDGFLLAASSGNAIVLLMFVH